jgi:hypothetical protein
VRRVSPDDTDRPKRRPAYDLEELYRDLGEYVVMFQLLENQVWQLGVQALGIDNFDRSRRALTGLAFQKLCDRTERAVFARLDVVGRAAPKYRSRVSTDDLEFD